MNGNSIFRNEKIWRFLTNFWTLAVLFFLILNFVTHGAYGFVGISFSIVYTAVLGLYAGTKEFDRWYEFHESRHPGEIFIVVWTIVIGGMLGAQFFLGKVYELPQEAIADYIMVLSIFALTQKSKNLHGKRRAKR
jgi:hypothetical protein